MKNKVLYIFLYLGVWLLNYEISAQPSGYYSLKDTSSFRTGLKLAAQRTKTIESDFVQEKNLSVMSEKITSKGHFYFKRENLLRWEYTSPFKYLIILNKQKILVKDETKENKYDMQSNKMFQEINRMIVNSVQGNILTTGEFKYKFFENNRYYLAELAPQAKNMRSFIKTINLFFDKKEFVVMELKIEEDSGDDTVIKFFNRKENVHISDEIFSIK